MELRYIIESEFDLFKDVHTKKRGMRHRRAGVGLNLDRKHQNVIADVHKAHPDQIPELERLRKAKTGTGFVNFNTGEQLKNKYGLTHDTGYLGTTGIKMSKTDNGYKLVKEAIVKIDDRKYTVRSPDDIYSKLPGTHAVFAIKDGIVYYMIGVGDTHINILQKVLTNTPDFRLQAFPKPTKNQFKLLVSQAETYRDQFKYNASRRDINDWGENGNPRLFFDITGRLNITTDNNSVIAFWNDSSRIKPYVDLIKSFLSHIHTNTDPIVVTLDNKDTTLDTMTHNTNVDTELLKIQHLVPDSKKSLKVAAGSKIQNTRAVDLGYNSAAEYNANRIIGDSING